MTKFLCDEMCAELGKWLRIAGYDTLVVNGPIPDPDIFKKAVYESRRLITRDKFFKTLDPNEKTIIYLQGDDLDGWAKQLKENGIKWNYRPFTRCLQCNSLFEKVVCPKNVPEKVKECWQCPTCHHLFWQGSHTERMENQLKKWARS